MQTLCQAEMRQNETKTSNGDAKGCSSAVVLKLGSATKQIGGSDQNHIRIFLTFGVNFCLSLGRQLRTDITVQRFYIQGSAIASFLGSW